MAFRCTCHVDEPWEDRPPSVMMIEMMIIAQVVETSLTVNNCPITTLTQFTFHGNLFCHNLRETKTPFKA